MRRYETIFISHPDLPEDDVEKLSQRAADIVQKQGGELLQVEQWGKKKLAYKIKKQWRGYYTLLDYAVTPAAVRELERILRLDDKVMKFLTVMIDERADLEAIRKSLAETKKPAVSEEETAAAPAEEEAAEPAQASVEEAPSESEEPTPEG